MPPNSPLNRPPQLVPNPEPSVDQGEGAGLRSVGEEELRPSGEGEGAGLWPAGEGKGEGLRPSGEGAGLRSAGEEGLITVGGDFSQTALRNRLTLSAEHTFILVVQTITQWTVVTF